MLTGKVVGQKKVRGFLRGSQAGIKLKTEKHEGDLAEEVVNLARDFVAVDTGRTQEFIRREQRRDGWAIISDRGGELPEVAAYLEFGTSKMAAQPYLQPAAEIVFGGDLPAKKIRAAGGLI